MRAILSYLFAFSLLLIVSLFLNTAYRHLIRYSASVDRSNRVYSSFQILSKQINNAAVIDPNLLKAGNSKALVFFSDSQTLIKQLQLLKQTVSDSINVKIAEKLNIAVKKELPWLLKSNVPDSIIHHKATGHVASLQAIDSLITMGIIRTTFVLEHQKKEFSDSIKNLAKWMVLFIILSGILIYYTTVNLYRQQAKRKEKEAELEKREKQYKHTLDNMLEGIQIHDPEWKYIYVNDSLVKSSKYVREELMGNTVMEKYPSIEKTELFKSMQRCMTERIAEQLDTEFVFPDGTRAHFELSIQPIPEGIFILSIDRTEQQKAKVKLQKANRLYAFLSAINQSIVHINNTQDLLDHTCNVAIEIGKFKMAWIDFIDESTNKLIIVSMRGVPGAIAEAKKSTVMNLDDPLLIGTPTGKVLRSGTYSVSNDVQNDPGMTEWKKELVKNEIKSGIAIPIKKAGKITGIFGFFAATENFFDEEEISLLEEATSDISFALELFDKTRKHEETEVLVVANEKRFRALIEKSADMKTMSDLEGRLTYCSPSVTKVLGYSSEEFLFKPAGDFIHPHNIAHLVENRKIVLQSPGSSFNFQYRFHHKNGNWIWCEGTLTNLLDEPGVNAIVTNLRDISERKIAEAHREFESNNLKALINNTNDLMWSVDLNLKVITFNDSFNKVIELMSGKPLEKGRDILSTHFTEDQINRYKIHYERALSGETFTILDHFESPVEVWAEISFYPIRQGNTVIGTACFSRDITKRKIAEEVIRQSERRLKKSQAIAHLGHWELDLLTNMTTWSDETCIIYGLSPAENKQTLSSLLSFIHPEDLDYVMAAIHISENTFSDNSLNHRIILKDGTIKHIYVETKFELDQNGKPVKLYGIAHDITERKQIETERELVLRELLKSNADLKQFSFIASHNLRAPLSNIQGICGMIDYSTLDAGNIKLLEMLNTSAEQLTKTIEDLTNILVIKNNVANAQIHLVNLPGVFENLYPTFASVLNEVDAKISTDFAVAEIEFNETYLHSILINLISNAIKYRSPKRKLLLHISSKNDTHGNTLLKFSDNGLGLDLNRYKDRLFGMYQQFHHNVKGGGMGLYIIKSQIEALNSKLEIESEPDMGTTFTIVFPSEISN